MFAFKLWSRFGAFRDPITITQNVTLSIPPKTTIGGILAAILGMDYNEYFKNPEYFNFGYSLVLKKPVRKKSFSQNYIGKYTERSESKTNGVQSLLEAKKLGLKEGLAINNFRFTIEKDPNYKTSIKPIKRELLLDPSYLIFIKDFEFEDQIVELLKSHNTGFALYMGNSEFSANYKFVECFDFEEKPLSRLNSFAQLQNDVKLESNRKYTSMYFATKTVEGRKYRDFKKIMISDKEISFNTPVSGVIVKTSEGNYNCEFI